MPQLQGGFGLTGTDNSRILSVTTESALRIFDNVSVNQIDQYARLLRIYGDVTLGRDLKGRFASFTTPKHILSNRKNGCTWNPKGGVRMNIDEFPTCPVVYDGEQCPDAFYGNCFERLFGPGNAVLDFAGTPEGQSVLAMLLQKIYQGLGNSFYSLYNFANHPLIELANTNTTYRAGVSEWEDYVDQMLSGECGGLITLLDQLALEGRPGYDIDIPNTDITESTGKYTGDIIALFETLKANASASMKTAIQSGFNINGRLVPPVIMATSYEFEAYKTYIRSIAGTNELAYRFMVDGQDGSTGLSRNILVYDGMPVIQWDAHAEFDALTGVQSHRVAIVAPGVFGVLHDVPSLDLFAGQGLMVEQSTRLQDKGKIFMTTNFRWGAGIANTDFVVMASNILHP